MSFDLDVRFWMYAGSCLGLSILLLGYWALWRRKRKSVVTSSIEVGAATQNGSPEAGPDSRGEELEALLEIEQSLMALRELYHRHLIPAEVYVLESRKIAVRLRDGLPLGGVN